MPWLKSEGKMPQNEKVWELSDAAYRLMDAGRHYAVQSMTDGHVPISRISALTPKPATKLVIHEVVRAKLWHQLPEICDSCRAQRKEHGAGALPKTGYVVHDFLVYNPSKAEYEGEQERKRNLAALGGQARAAQAPRSGGRFTSQDTSRSTSHDTSGAAGQEGGFHQPGHQQAAGEKAPAAPAVAPASGPAVAPAPYPVSRPVAIATSTPRAREDEEPEIPAGTAAKAAGATKAPHHVAPTVGREAARLGARR